MLFVSSHAELGGSERYLEQVLAHLPPEMVAGVVVLEDGPYVERFAAAGHRVWLVPAGGKSGVLKGVPRLARLIASSGAGVVHANGVKAALTAVLASPPGVGAPVVWMKHDCSFDGPLGRAVARASRTVVGVSTTVVDGVRDAARDARVIPNGIPEIHVDRAAARERLRNELALPADAAIVVQVARIVANKGQHELLDAFERLAPERPGLHLVLVGEPDRHSPEYAEEVRGRAARLDGRVHLLGYREDAVELIAGADVLAAPSLSSPGSNGWREGFGLVVAEAMAAGTPVVAFEDPALSETLAGCGRLAPTGDSAALAAALATVLDDDAERERMVRCGSERAATLGLRSAVDRLAAVYEELLPG